MRLTEVERGVWIRFHEFAYKDDLELAESILKKHPRWSIISGYYAMHDIAKLYLGKVHNVKISGPETHRQTIDMLKKTVRDNKERERIVSLLETAEREIKDIQPESIPYLLLTGRKERGKTQYYSTNVKTRSIDYTGKAIWFIERIVKVFVKIMEKLVD